MEREKSKKTRIIVFVVCLVCLVLFIILGFVRTNIINKLPTETAGERWANGGKDACLTSCNFSANTNIDTLAIATIRETINDKLKQSSFDVENKDKRVWLDAYSADIGDVEVRGSRSIILKAKGTAVGGDFFAINSFKLVKGNYFSDSDLMNDYVVIDKRLAFNVFGSSDVVGMPIIIGDVSFTVAGVVEPLSGKAGEIAQGTRSRVYVNYNRYFQGKQNSSNEENSKNSKEKKPENKPADNSKITCYQAVLPEPIKEYGHEAVRQAVYNLCGENGYEIVDNSKRYSYKNTWEHLKKLGEDVVVENEMGYMFWENAARINQVYVQIIYVIRLVLIIPVVLWILWFIGRLWGMRKYKTTAELYNAIMDKIYDIRYKRMVKKGKNIF